MRRVGFCFKVKPELIPEYKRRHQEVWPDMLQALRETGWHNYSLFLRDDGLLFGYVEVEEDFARSLEGMAGGDVLSRWQAEMAPFFEQLDGQRPDEGMLRLEEVFHLD